MQVNVNIQLDQTKCIKCKSCIRTCYQNVYRWDEEKNEIVAAYPEDCVSCVMCMMNCPRGCIEVVPLPVHKFDPLVGA